MSAFLFRRFVFVSVPPGPSPLSLLCPEFIAAFVCLELLTAKLTLYKNLFLCRNVVAVTLKKNGRLFRRSLCCSQKIPLLGFFRRRRLTANLMCVFATANAHSVYSATRLCSCSSRVVAVTGASAVQWLARRHDMHVAWVRPWLERCISI